MSPRMSRTSVRPSGDTSTDTQVASLVVNAILRASGRGVLMSAAGSVLAGVSAARTGRASATTNERTDPGTSKGLRIVTPSNRCRWNARKRGLLQSAGPRRSATMWHTHAAPIHRRSSGNHRPAFHLLGSRWPSRCCATSRRRAPIPPPSRPRRPRIGRRSSTASGAAVTASRPASGSTSPRASSSSRPYRWGAAGALLPEDLALAWGPVLEPPYSGGISYSQFSRFFFWRTKDMALNRDTIVTHTANVHVVPRTIRLKRAVRAVDEGDVVRLQGFLVDLDGDRRSRLPLGHERHARRRGPGARARRSSSSG